MMAGVPDARFDAVQLYKSVSYTHLTLPTN